MAALKRNNTSCSTCGKTAGTFICRGCSENFCLPHTVEHRENIEKQMNDIVLIHNQLKQDVDSQETDRFHRSLLEQIEQWEQQSIEKIHQVANETRQHLTLIVRDRTDKLKEKIAQLTKQLSKARRDGEFFESEIKDWSEKLTKFQQFLQRQQKIKVHHDKNSVPLISKISLYDLPSDTAVEPISESPYLSNQDDIIHDSYEDFSNAKDKGEYSIGVHRLRFQIDQYDINSTIIFGIISKGIFNDKDPLENPTLYGWTGNNIVYRAGKAQANYGGYRSDIRTGDVFIFTMDCDEEKIILSNERTRRTYSLDVDTEKCPLPWQLNVRYFVNPE